MDSSKLSYRAEIDGLRAIAVVSVILYHAKIVLFGIDLFEGGFIGVDIFFVISGYLITRIILSELELKGSFSFLNFYERRARRILPMLFVVILVSLPLAWQKLLPSAFAEYAESILASLFFGSNFFFYFSTTEYGAESALLKPFLHTWSLGVEEQFYLVFPILAIIAHKYFRKHFLTILFGLSLLSLQFAELMEVRNADLNFYLPFSRFWELAAGSILAYREMYYKQSNEGFASKSLPMIGLYLIAYSILFFDGKTPHPSFHTLIPIIGVALIIGFASKDELVGKVLGTKPFVWAGLISYSAYLWHFPIFAFSRIGKEPANYDKFGYIALTITLSALTYFLIEKPFRVRSVFRAKSFFVIMLGSMALVSFTIAYLIIRADGFVDRFPIPVGFENYELDNEKLRAESWLLLREREDKNPNFNNVKNKILIVGNSHAKDFYNALVQNGYVNSKMDVLRGQLPQIRCANETIDSYAPSRDKFYSSRQWIESTTILISTRYQKGQCDDNDEVQSSDIDGLVFLIKKAKLDGKRVIVLGNTIEFDRVEGKWVADYVYDLYRDGAGVAFKSEVVISDAARLLWVQRTNATDKNKIIANIARDYKVPYFDKVPLICSDNNETCDAFTDDGHKVSYDNSHWTMKGAKFAGERLADQGFDHLIE